MAKITYIKESQYDGKAQIYIENEPLESSAFRDGIDDNIHSIQWNRSSGEIEYNDGTSNKTISDISSYNLETKHATEKKAIADAKADRIANMTYAEKRAEEYPSIVDQLDMIYHAGQGGDAFQKAIKAVKDKYPKG